MRFPAILAITFLVLAAPAVAETFEVKMLNGNATGGMVFEPEFLSIQPGDTVKFLATQRGHNAATIEGYLPEGATPFKGKINEEIEVTFEQDGFYGIKCTPHYDMGMVMLIRVGDQPFDALQPPEKMPAGATKRFEAILDRAND